MRRSGLAKNEADFCVKSASAWRYLPLVATQDVVWNHYGFLRRLFPGHGLPTDPVFFSSRLLCTGLPRSFIDGSFNFAKFLNTSLTLHMSDFVATVCLDPLDPISVSLL